MANTIKVPISNLKVGMFVSRLDRPWLETPFLLQGFEIESYEEIEILEKYCDYVHVDLALSSNQSGSPFATVAPLPKKRIADIFAGKTISTYTDKASWREEFPKAKAALQILSESVHGILSSVTKSHTFSMVKVKSAVEPMIDSISRNPDACIWLARMKTEDDYSYHHSIGCSIWAVALGRQLGLPKADLRSLAIGGLLLDIGKLQVDKAILNSNRKLTNEEFEQIKQHVPLGLESLKNSGVLNQNILEMSAYHHERHDGRGYPEGLSGDDIPVFARIAGLVDCYDAITTHRKYAKAMTPAAAIKNLYEFRDIDFQAELVEEFIQAIGIYPAGTLVELSSGEVAIVIAEYRSRRLRPQVMVLLDKEKQPLTDVRFIDLMTETETTDGKPLEIVNSLEPEAYGIDMTAIVL